MRRLVVLSPHYDDAVCSVGAAIAARSDAGDDVVIVTVCGAAVDASRACDDRRAAGIVGARAMHLGVKDAPLRGHTLSYEALCCCADDDDVAAVMADAIADVVAGADDVWAPLGVGAHVDHRALFQATLVTTTSAAFYEDRPYARAPGAVATRWRALGAERDEGNAADDDDAQGDDDVDHVVYFLDHIGASALPSPRRAPALVRYRGLSYRRERLVVSADGRRRRLEAIEAYRSEANVLVGGSRGGPGWPWTDGCEHLWSATR